MRDFIGRIAVVTGAGSGIGRELAIHLAAQGSHVALADLSADGLQESQRLCEGAKATSDLRFSTHLVDVSERSQVEHFQHEVARTHNSPAVDLLINNAGIGGSTSFVKTPEEKWQRIFNICWGGTYNCTRVFLEMLMRSNEAYIVNMSSVNGLWACLGPHTPHSAYATAKFAIRGFTESLICDLRINAPHIKCALVMPGHIGTPFFTNSMRINTGQFSAEPTAEQIDLYRNRLEAAGMEIANLDDWDLRQKIKDHAKKFLEGAPLSARDAAIAILEGVKADRWRIVVGQDAEKIDGLIRSCPEEAYEFDFFAKLARTMGWTVN